MKNTRAKKQPKMAKRAAKPKPKRTMLGNAMVLAGNVAGKYFGGDVGQYVGDKAGKAFSRITGQGKYKVRGNTLVTNAAPMFKKRNGGTEIVHREFLTDVLSSTDFNPQQITINAGLTQCFPWLSPIANRYEQYELLGMVFEYRPTSGSAIASTNNALGVVVFATNYDVYDQPFSSKLQMESYEFSTSCEPSEHMIHPVECAPRDSTLRSQYVWSGPTVATSDARFYDKGVFTYATVGMQAENIVVGELWVSYHVRLIRPKIHSTLDVVAEYSHFREFPTATATVAAPLGTSGGEFTVNPLGLTLTTTGNGININIKTRGTYLIVCAAQATTYTSNTFDFAFIGTNLTANSFLFNGTAYQCGSMDSNNGGFIACVNVIRDGTGVSNDCQLLMPTGAYTNGEIDAFVFPLGASLQSVLPKAGSGPDLTDIINRLRRLETPRDYDDMSIRSFGSVNSRRTVK